MQTSDQARRVSAGTGIGQGIAVELARQGADVAVHYAHTEPEETVKVIDRSGRRYTTVQGCPASVTASGRTRISTGRSCGA